MRITWITRSFLDYRVPVFDELNKLTDGNLTLIYYKDAVPERVRKKTEKALGQNAIGLSGEIRLIGKKSYRQGGCFGGLRIPFQPGLVKTVRRSKPAIMVTDGFFQWTTAALWVRATKGIPHVMLYERTAHTESNAQWFRKAYRKMVLRWIDVICCTGSLCEEYTRSLGFKGEITYGHMVADIDSFQTAVDMVSIPKEEQIKAKYQIKGTSFLYVGGLIPRKGIDKLLPAWKTVNEKYGHEEKTLILIGEGRQHQKLEKYCRIHQINNVRFIGAIDYDSLAPFYKAADAFIIPTLEDNWAMVIPEAMSSGLPILCSKYSGCYPELIKPENGWVFDPLNTDDTVQCLLKCLESKDKLQKMGKRSQEIIASGHTPRHAAQAIYDSCQKSLA